MMKIASDTSFETDVLRYADTQARQALHHFSAVRGIELLLASAAAGTATCRLIVTFASGSPVVVGHSAPAILHAIDTAVDTAAHIVAARASSAN